MAFEDLHIHLQNYFVRSMRARRLLEYFMLAAVSTILGVRLFLEIAGYPQVGGSQLHIAHVLYGGVLMIAAFLMLFIFMNRGVQAFAALVAGAGFGLFIDEVGKFVTKDNNYFFQPSAAIIYVFFVLIFLVSRTILTSRRFNHTEQMTNAISEMEELPRRRLRQDVKEEIVGQLEKCESKDPLARELKLFIQRMDAVPSPAPGPYDRVKNWLSDRYRRIASSRWFVGILIFLFALQVVGAAGVVLTVLFDAGNIQEDLELFSFADYAILFSSLLSSAFVLWGILRIRRNRLGAFRMFERSMLVSIFITEFFLFWKDAFGAVPGFVFDLLLLLAIRFIIEREETAASSDKGHEPQLRAAA